MLKVCPKVCVLIFAGRNQKKKKMCQVVVVESLVKVFLRVFSVKQNVWNAPVESLLKLGALLLASYSCLKHHRRKQKL